MKKILIFSVILLLLVRCTSEEGPAPIIADVALVNPLNNEICEQGINTNENRSRVFFEWEMAENAQSYDLVVNDLESGENFITYEEIYDTRKELELIHNRAYEWYVISKHSESDDTGISPTWNFFFVGEPRENYAPFPANIISPEFGNVIQSMDGNVSLQWEASDPDQDTLSFTIFIDEIDGMQTPDESLTNIQSTSIDVQLESGKNYYWRVRSSDGNSSSYSQIYTFTLN